MKGSCVFAIGFICFILGLVFVGTIASVGPNQMVRKDVLNDYCISIYGNDSYYDDDTFYGIDINVTCDVKQKLFNNIIMDYEVVTFIVPSGEVRNVYDGGLVTCQEYLHENKTYDMEGAMYDIVVNGGEDDIYCAYKRPILRSDALHAPGEGGSK